MEWCVCVCVCVCVNRHKKTLVLWDICASGITSRFAPCSWKQGARTSPWRDYSALWRESIWIGKKSQFLTYETARYTLELANNTMLYGLFPAASVGSNFTDLEPPSSDITYARRHAQDCTHCDHDPTCAQQNVASEFRRQPRLLLCGDSFGQHPFETQGLPPDLVQKSLSPHGSKGNLVQQRARSTRRPCDFV